MRWMMTLAAIALLTIPEAHALETATTWAYRPAVGVSVRQQVGWQRVSLFGDLSAQSWGGLIGGAGSSVGFITLGGAARVGVDWHPGGQFMEGAYLGARAGVAVGTYVPSEPNLVVDSSAGIVAGHRFKRTEDRSLSTIQLGGGVLVHHIWAREGNPLYPYNVIPLPAVELRFGWKAPRATS